MLQHYPTELSRNLTPFLYDLIKSVLPTNPEASVLFASRHLKPDLTGIDFINALKVTNEELLEATQNDITRMGPAYAGWILERFNSLGDPNLVSPLFLAPRSLSIDIFSLQRIYLALSLHNHCSIVKFAPHMMAADLKLLSSLKSSSPVEPSKLLNLSRRYSSKSTHPQLWLARLDIEKQYGTAETAASTWDEARRRCRSDGSEAVWLWGAQRASLRQHEVGTMEMLWVKSLLTQTRDSFWNFCNIPFYHPIASTKTSSCRLCQPSIRKIQT